jgi:hypothetical protein
MRFALKWEHFLQIPPIQGATNADNRLGSVAQVGAARAKWRHCTSRRRSEIWRWSGKPGKGAMTKSGMPGPPDAKGQTGVHFNKGLPNEM